MSTVTLAFQADVTSVWAECSLASQTLYLPAGEVRKGSGNRAYNVSFCWNVICMSHGITARKMDKRRKQ